MNHCLLCAKDGLGERRCRRGRLYFDCSHCGLIMLDPALRLDAAAEKYRYEQHRNVPSDPDYRKFLGRALTPLIKQLKPGRHGLDYGCGPGPTVAVMLQEQGLVVDNYDPFFYPRQFSATDQFDFITATEVVEHFFDPLREFERCAGLLRKGGWLAIMTEVFADSQPFADWWYLKDPTHVCFYRSQTFQWLAGRFKWDVLCPHPNVRLFQAVAADQGAFSVRLG